MELPDQEAEFEKLLQRLPCNDAPRSAHQDLLRQKLLSRWDAEPVVLGMMLRWLWMGREIMRRPVSKVAMFVAALGFGLWFILPSSHPTAAAFNKLVDQIMSAKTAKFQLKVKIEGQPEMPAKAYFQSPGRFRQETGDIISLTDFEAGKMVTVQPKIKLAVVMNLKGADKEKFRSQFDRLRDLIAQNRKADDSNYEKLGEKEVAGKKAVGFRIVTVAENTTLWGAPDTGLPILIDVEFTGVPKMRAVMSDFEINPELPADLFDTKIPENYKVQTLDVDASPAKEGDLIASFRGCADLTGGTFPDGIDTASVMNSMIKTILKEKDGKVVPPTEKETQALMQKAISIGRGFDFAVKLPASADAHYAGKDVRKDTADRPIFWYRPEGSTKYRVIFADLSARDADRAPEIQGTRLRK